MRVWLQDIFADDSWVSSTIVSQLSSATGLVISSATVAQNVDTSQGTSRYRQPRQRHRQPRQKHQQFRYKQPRHWQLMQRYQQLRQRHWQLKYLAAETLATDTGSQRHWQLKYWQPETLATEMEAPATKSTSVAGSSMANNYVTVLFVVSLFISPLIFNIVNYT